MKLHITQRKNLRIDVAVAGNSALVAQHALTFYRKNKADQQFARVGMRRGLHQCDRMNIGNHRLVEDVLHRAALAFDARGDVRVGIGHGVELPRGQKLRRDVVAVAHARLLRGERL